MNHTRLESMFHKKHTPHMYAYKPRHTHASHVHTHDSMYAYVYIVHIVDIRVTLQSFVMIEYILQILQINLFGLEKC